MMSFKLPKIVSASVLILSAVVLIFTLYSCAPRPVTPVPPTTVAPRVVYTDGGFDWGWLGLIGLFGLAGLAGGRKRRDTTR
ncbi:MAG: hypothetical protein CLLPBCKN_000326 [Chroococcidiopsis cubana SAG 39.79]|jgi:MYXO-CTERM domain-containing protein|uniref:Uncharacterized protein n=2 Tax=Chroococcidiopsis TaxID=54298 RepID=K9U3T3_CHRTP|nr:MULTISPECIES: WGxxGxxG family protein [Chroococcidiopsis]AFY89273.1 hypothetical protein Chro_3851 [Chroococcidiopsis thermalis PCC 7203]MDZ4870938.1 hypothetical protein [Chroococcidiopsis cubana SAG 39.79]RUT10396.1 hypothetical protein DSM107010_42840 [Chroococcidiopsis cubana SAG 39.79]URD48394.1 WGxxGxxG-CTERM domain-containing protein [Chroococcidiopsis sp. CCNUC1]